MDIRLVSYLLKKGVYAMTYYAKRGVIYNEIGEAVLVVTPISIDKSFARSYAKIMAEDLNDADNGEQAGGAI